MSIWSYINGTVTVDIDGISQAHGEYILKETLSHLPDVIPYLSTERQFDIFINQPIVCNNSDSHDEFMVCASKPKYNIENMNRFAVPNNYRYHDGWIERNSTFILTIHGSFRDCTFTDCLKAFNKWLTRLAKRVWVNDVFIRIIGEENIVTTDSDGYPKYIEKDIVLTDDSYAYGSMYEYFGKENEDKCNWTQYMYPELLNKGRFATGKYNSIPRMIYKYYCGKDILDEIESDVILEYNREIMKKQKDKLSKELNL